MMDYGRMRSRDLQSWRAPVQQGELTVESYIVGKLKQNARYFGFNPAENYPEILIFRDAMRRVGY